ncbi:MAG: hypothetical protein ACKO01_03375 [Erythrobacter sp.]
MNFDAFTPNLLAQPRMSTAENSSREWSSFQVAEQSEFIPVVRPIISINGQVNLKQATISLIAEVAQGFLYLTSQHPLIAANQKLIHDRNVSSTGSIGTRPLSKLQIGLLRLGDRQSPFAPKQHSQALDQQRLSRCLWFVFCHELFKQIRKKIAILMACEKVRAQHSMP